MKVCGDSRVTKFSQTNHSAVFRVNSQNGEAKIFIELKNVVLI